MAGLPEEATEKGRIRVDASNRVEGTNNVYAIGDLALMKTSRYPTGHPMVAPVAIQQARLLGKNLVRQKKGQPIKPFRYLHKGTMATIGRNKAVVDLPGNITLGGLPAWITWMFVHLVSIYGLRNKVVVLINWVYNYFTYDKGTRLIIRKFKPAFLNGGKNHKAVA
jgi:NADH dehydrogenase